MTLKATLSLKQRAKYFYPSSAVLPFIWTKVKCHKAVFFYTCENSLFHLPENFHLLFHPMGNAALVVIALPAKYIQVNKGIKRYRNEYKGIQRYTRVSMVIHCLKTGDYMNMLPVKSVLRLNLFLPRLNW